jgi:hypothetical protein
MKEGFEQFVHLVRKPLHHCEWSMGVAREAALAAILESTAFVALLSALRLLPALGIRLRASPQLLS